jgi:hypothetical protein
MSSSMRAIGRHSIGIRGAGRLIHEYVVKASEIMRSPTSH